MLQPGPFGAGFFVRAMVVMFAIAWSPSDQCAIDADLTRSDAIG